MTLNIAPPPPIKRQNLTQTSLSYSQESLWFLQQLDPDNTAYNTINLVKFTGGIDLPSFERALNELVRRHEPLRTIYPNRGGKPVQFIQAFEPFSLPFVDFSGMTEEERQEAVRRYVSDHGNQPFDLQRGPVVRIALLHTSKTEDFLFFCLHHIGSDAWSWQIMRSELVEMYSAFRSGKVPHLPELPVQYSDYVDWQKKWLSGETLETYLAHWNAILDGELPVLEIPTDRPRPVPQSSRGASYSFRLSGSFSAQMKDFCQTERVTKFHVLMAAYAILLMRHSGQEDIILGCPFANRPRIELDRLVGYFVNTLPIRLNLKGNPIARDFLTQVRSKMLDAFAWQAVPFEALVSKISLQRDMSRTPVYQVLINLRNVPKRSSSIEGLEMQTTGREDGPSAFDFSLDFDEEVDGSLEASLQYNPDLYDENTIIHLVAHYQNLLGELVKKADRPLSDLEMLTASEFKRMVVDWNQTETSVPQVCIHDMFTKKAELNPAAMAVECNGSSLTYGALEEKSNQLAHYLISNGVAAESRVGIFLPRSEKMVVAMLGILKAGGALVPLDLIYPMERTAFIINDSDPAAIITLSTLRDQLPAQVKKIFLDADSGLIDSCEKGKPSPTTDHNALAYIIYTSGSTGRPKGAMNTHRGIVNYISFMINHFHFCSSDRTIQFTSLSFDSTVWEILGSLAAGGTILLMDDNQMRDPDFLSQAIVNLKVTHFCAVPTMLRAICESALAREPGKNSLKLLSLGGEVLQTRDVDFARRAFGESVQVNNQYGPTECSICVTHYMVPPVLPAGLQGIPIGKPVDNSRIYLLDEYLHPVPQGGIGEIFIGGTSVGRGYWNQPELTAERFLPDPFQAGGRVYRTGDVARQLADGTICFLGRTDAQVKIRGYRVELGEIEAVVNEFPGVKEAAVVLRHDPGGETLAAYITLLEGSAAADMEKMHAALADRLPFFMLPSSITILEEMPISPVGKIDRLALPLPTDAGNADHYLAPRNETESRLADIWEEVLGVERVGVRDNFFELGGHSLLAVRLFTLIQEEFDVSLPLMLLFQNGTIEAVAQALSQEEKSNVPEGVAPIQPQGSGLPLFIISAGLYMRELALALGNSRPVFALNSVENGQVVYRKSVQETASIYYKNLVDFLPHGPYLLLGHSAQGFFTLELARLLIQNGHEVAFLGLLDTYPPDFKSQANLFEKIVIYSENYRGKNFAESLKYFGQTVRRNLNRFFSRAGAEMDIIEHLEKQGQVKEVRSLILDLYQPEIFDGQVTLFSASERPYHSKAESMELWKHTLTGKSEIVPIPGDHMSSLQPPHVAFVAEKIESFLPKRDQ